MKRSVVANTVPTSYQDLVKHFQMKGQATRKIQSPMERHNVSATSRQQHNASRMEIHQQQHTQSVGYWDKKGKSHSREKEVSTPKNSSLRLKTIGKHNTSQQTIHNQSNRNQGQPENYTIVPTPTSTTIDTNQQLLYNRFINQITTLLSQTLHSKPPQMLMQKLSYIHYLSIVKELKMIHDNYEPSSNDCVGMLWNQFAGQNNVGNFILLIASVLKVNKHDQMENIGCKQLWKKYQQLRYTRCSLLGKKEDIEYGYQYPFHPMISQRSHVLANKSKSRGKICQRNCYGECGEQCSHGALTVRNCNVDCKAVLGKMMKSSSKTSIIPMSQCKTHIQNQSRVHTQNQNQTPVCVDNKLGIKRSEILYKLAKEKSVQKRMDKPPFEIEYEKAAGQLTFKPEIHPVAKQTRRMKIRGEQISISRMVRGRVEREIRKVINDKGLPYNEKMFQKMRNEKYGQILKNRKVITQQSEDNQVYKDKQTHNNKHDIPSLMIIDELQPHQPLHTSSEEQPQQSAAQSLPSSDTIKKYRIVLDIYLDEQRCEKLKIEQGQSDQQAASNFIRQHGLSSEMYQKLLRELQKASKFQLAQIDQDSYESDVDDSQPVG